MNMANYNSEPICLGKWQKVYLSFKRILDFVFAVLLGIILLIPMVLISVSIMLDSPGPAIFTQQRMGRNEKPFTIYKFRTMTMDAPKDVATRKLPESHKFITRVGAFLRRTSMDELPQLWNIIIGDMSLIGYRPICLSEERVNDLRKSAGVFVLRPGITGLAQVNGRDDIGDEEKVRYDTKYVRECSLKMDLYCLVNTVTTVISGKGAR